MVLIRQPRMTNRSGTSGWEHLHNIIVPAVIYKCARSPARWDSKFKGKSAILVHFPTARRDWSGALEGAVARTHGGSEPTWTFGRTIRFWKRRRGRLGRRSTSYPGIARCKHVDEHNEAETNH